MRLPTAVLSPTRIEDVPWYRRNRFGALLMFVAIAACFAGGIVPMLLWLADISVGLLGSLLITGDIYYAEREADGALKRWSLPNKALTGALAMTSMALIVRTFLRI